MKKITLILVSLFLTAGSFAQFSQHHNAGEDKNEIQYRFSNRKDKGFYSMMQVSLLLGNNQYSQRIQNSYPGYYTLSAISAPSYSYYNQNRMGVSPSFTFTNGYMFNEHWAVGAGVGFEIFDHNLFPLFAELRYTLWDSKISPFVSMKGGYSVGNFKAKHFDDLYLSWSPYYLTNVHLRHYGGRMLHPEVGVKVPLTENSDLLLTAAYRHQKTRSVAWRETDSNQSDEWEHKENLSRLSFGVAIMFR